MLAPESVWSLLSLGWALASLRHRFPSWVVKTLDLLLGKTRGKAIVRIWVSAGTETAAWPPHHLLTSLRRRGGLLCRTTSTRLETRMDQSRRKRPSEAQPQQAEAKWGVFATGGNNRGRGQDALQEGVDILWGAHRNSRNPSFILTTVRDSSCCWLMWGHLLACLIIQKIRMPLANIATLGTWVFH